MTKYWTLLGLLALALAISTPALAGHHESAAEDEAEDRAVMMSEAVDLEGKVVSVDRETKTLVIEGPLGRQLSIVAPEEAPNFDQIKVGDPVLATYIEAIALSIAPVADAKPGASALASVSTAPPGATPSGVMAEQIELRAVVAAVDPEARTVTLDVPAGGQRTLQLDEGVDLANVKTGEQVSVVLTRALAISIDKR